MKRWSFLFGCTRCSPACENCYAISRCWRFMHNPNMKGRADGTVHRIPNKKMCGTNPPLDWTGRVNFHEPAMDIPLRIKKPTRFFVNAFSDTFHENVGPETIDNMLDVISACAQHEFYIPTKRLHLAEEKLYGITPEHGCRDLGGGDYYPNVWILYSAWNQESFDAGLPHAAKLREQGWKIGVSLEPLLEPVDVLCGLPMELKPKNPFQERTGIELVSTIREPGFDLVIVGPERAGKRSRPCKREWIDSVVRQCDAAGVEVVDKTVKEPE